MLARSVILPPITAQFVLMALISTSLNVCLSALMAIFRIPPQISVNNVGIVAWSVKDGVATALNATQQSLLTI